MTLDVHIPDVHNDKCVTAQCHSFKVPRPAPSLFLFCLQGEKKGRKLA